MVVVVIAGHTHSGLEKGGRDWVLWAMAGLMLAALLLSAAALPAWADGLARPVQIAPVHFEEREQTVIITGESAEHSIQHCFRKTHHCIRCRHSRHSSDTWLS